MSKNYPSTQAAEGWCCPKCGSVFVLWEGEPEFGDNDYDMEVRVKCDGCGWEGRAFFDLAFQEYAELDYTDPTPDVSYIAHSGRDDEGLI